jgi:DNA-binding response OmpR family regulator
MTEEPIESDIASEGAAAAAGGVVGSSTHSVLLVDHDKAIAEMYREGLQDHGFAVTVVGGVGEALASVAAKVPDIAVVTWEMPVRGDELLIALRHNARSKDVPVLMFSNHPLWMMDDAVKQRMFEAWSAGWLEKIKTTPRDLADRITEVLRDGRAS